MTIGTWSLPKYNQVFFVSKHILTFLTAGIFIITVVLYFYRKFRNQEGLINTPGRLRILQALTVLTITLLLFIIAFQQNSYIDEWETPPVEACYYYDQYGNYIHGSRMTYSCPEPTIIQDSENRLILEFEYVFVGEREHAYSSGTGVFGDYQYNRVEDGYGMVRVELHYTNEGIIHYRRYQEAINYIQLAYSRDEDGKEWENQFTVIDETKISNYTEIEIVTDINDGEIVQTKSEYYLRNQLNDFSSISEYHYHDFQDVEPTYDSVTRLYYEQDEEKTSYEIYMDYPYRDRVGEKATDEGFVDSGSHGLTFDYRWTDDKLNPDIEPFREISHVLVFDDKKIDSHIETRLGHYTEYSYKYIDEFGLNVCIGERKTSEFINSSSYEWNEKISNYRDEYYFNDRFRQYVLSKEDFGFIVRQYYADGVKSDEQPIGYADELRYFQSSRDHRTLIEQDMVYDNLPVFSTNPIVRILLSIN